MSGWGIELVGSPGSLAALLGITSAAGFAIANAIQHMAAGEVGMAGSCRHLLLQLVIRPRWLVGTIVGGAAFVLHAVAVGVGSLALVQPLMILGVVLAVPLRAALDRDRPSRRELSAVALACLGVGLLISLATGEEGYETARPWALLSLGLSCGFLAWVVTSAASRRRGGSSGQAAAVAAGLVFGFTACLMRIVGDGFHRGGWAVVVTSWATWLMLGTGLVGLALNQRAYQLARISQTMPILNAVDVGVAILAGWTVFGASPHLSFLRVAGYSVALTLVVLGLRRVGRTIETRESRPTAPHTPGVVPPEVGCAA